MEESDGFETLLSLENGVKAALGTHTDSTRPTVSLVVW